MADEMYVPSGASAPARRNVHAQRRPTDEICVLKLFNCFVLLVFGKRAKPGYTGKDPASAYPSVGATIAYSLHFRRVLQLWQVAEPMRLSDFRILNEHLSNT